MKLIFLLIIVGQFATSVVAQGFENDNNLKYPATFIKEFSLDNKYVSLFSYGLAKYQSDKLCIEFDFEINGNIKSLRPDSIILATVDNKEIILKYPYRDSIYINSNGNLNVSIINFLEPEVLAFMKTNLIHSVILIIENGRSHINLSRKNRTLLKEKLFSD